MGEKIEDGGPVIPAFQQYIGQDEYTYLEPQGGMRLRDMFAAAALQGLLAGPLTKGTWTDHHYDETLRTMIETKRDWSAQEIANYSLHLADALLKERDNSK